jgi:hypothetical protein
VHPDQRDNSPKWRAKLVHPDRQAIQVQTGMQAVLAVTASRVETARQGLLEMLDNPAIQARRERLVIRDLLVGYFRTFD